MREGFRQAMAWLHTWIGLIFGWLLFAIFLTGTLSYFKDEINRWTHPEIPVRSVAASASLERAQHYLQEHAAGASRWVISLPGERQPQLGLAWQSAAQEGRRGAFTRVSLDPQNGAEIAARESAGGEFFYRFHFQLQMPYPWGRWLSTAAAMLMFIALITGIITHKKIFKEFFTFRPRKGQRSWLDAHNALGVLVLPFHLMITYSSLVIFMFMVMPASLMTAYGNDTRAFFADIFPDTGGARAAGVPAALTSLPALLASARQHWPDGTISRVEVNRPGDANATVVLFRSPADSVIRDLSQALVFSGTSGALQREPAPRSGPMKVSGSFYGLHIGEFAGPLLRWLYFLFGVAGTAMIGTGLVMWLRKRQLKHAVDATLPLQLRLVQVLNIASMAGLMLAVAAFFCSNRLLPVQLAGRGDWEITLFFSVWGLSLVHAAVRSSRQAWREQLALAGLLFTALPVLDLLTGSAYLRASIEQGDWVLLGFDLTALATGVFMAWAATRFAPLRHVQRGKAAAATPFESGAQ